MFSPLLPLAFDHQFPNSNTFANNTHHDITQPVAYRHSMHAAKQSHQSPSRAKQQTRLLNRPRPKFYWLVSAVPVAYPCPQALSEPSQTTEATRSNPLRRLCRAAPQTNHMLLPCRNEALKSAGPPQFAVMSLRVLAIPGTNGGNAAYNRGAARNA